MGRSREPPVYTRFGQTRDETNITSLMRYAPKRLRSRPWAITRRNNVTFEDEDGDYPDRDWQPKLD